jgi:hypothetical protein
LRRRSSPAARPPSGLSADERHAYDQLDFFYKHGLAYAQEMSHRPQTLYGIEDSPVGLAAWMLDHDARSYELITRVFAGQKEGLTRDDILDNVTLYWLTNTGSLRLVSIGKASLRKIFSPRKGVTIPVAVSAFPDEIYTAPRSWTEKAYPKLIYYNRLRQRRALRSLGTAASLFRGTSREFPFAALNPASSERRRSDEGQSKLFSGRIPRAHRPGVGQMPGRLLLR